MVSPNTLSRVSAGITLAPRYTPSGDYLPDSTKVFMGLNERGWVPIPSGHGEFSTQFGRMENPLETLLAEMGEEALGIIGLVYCPKIVEEAKERLSRQLGISGGMGEVDQAVEIIASRMPKGAIDRGDLNHIKRSNARGHIISDLSQMCQQSGAAPWTTISYSDPKEGEKNVDVYLAVALNRTLGDIRASRTEYTESKWMTRREVETFPMSQTIRGVVLQGFGWYKEIAAIEKGYQIKLPGVRLNNLTHGPVSGCVAGYDLYSVVRNNTRIIRPTSASNSPADSSKAPYFPGCPFTQCPVSRKIKVD